MAKSTSHPSDLADKFMLRLPDGLREMLKLQAEHNKRSMNAEIVARLLESLSPWEPGEEPYKQIVTKHEFEATTFDMKDFALRLEKVEEALAKKSGKK